MKNRYALLFLAIGSMIPIGSYCLYRLIKNTIATWSTQNILAFVTILVFVASIIIPFIIRMLNRKGPVIRADLCVKPLASGHCILTVSVENIGDEIVLLGKSNLYVDEGVEEELGCNGNSNSNGTLPRDMSSYDFPFLTDYVSDKEDDCKLYKAMCKEEKGALDYPSDAKMGGKFHGSYEVKRFSDKSVRNLKPKEKFVDDVVIKISKNGVFRALFVTVTKNAKCSCSSKEFVIVYASNQMDKESEVETNQNDKQAVGSKQTRSRKSTTAKSAK